MCFTNSRFCENSDNSWGKPVQITQGPTILHMFWSLSVVSSVDLQISPLRTSPSYSATDTQSFRFSVKSFIFARGPDSPPPPRPLWPNQVSGPAMKGQAELSDARSSGRPATVTQALLQRADELIGNYRRITTWQRATELSASRKCEHKYWCVGMFKSVCSLGSTRPNRLPQNSRCEDDGKSFVKRIVSRDAVGWFFLSIMPRGQTISSGLCTKPLK